MKKFDYWLASKKIEDKHINKFFEIQYTIVFYEKAIQVKIILIPGKNVWNYLYFYAFQWNKIFISPCRRCQISSHWFSLITGKLIFKPPAVDEDFFVWNYAIFIVIFRTYFQKWECFWGIGAIYEVTLCNPIMFIVRYFQNRKEITLSPNIIHGLYYVVVFL